MNVLGHVLGSILGLIFAIFGTFAPGAYLATSRAGGLGLVAMDITVLGSALFLPGMGVSAFSAPEEGQAYLASMRSLNHHDSTMLWPPHTLRWAEICGELDWAQG